MPTTARQAGGGVRTYMLNQLLEYSASQPLTLQELTALFPAQYRNEVQSLAQLLNFINDQRQATREFVTRQVDLECQVMDRDWQTEKEYLHRQSGLLEPAMAAAEDEEGKQLDLTQAKRYGQGPHVLPDGSRLVSVHDAILLLNEETQTLDAELDLARAYTSSLFANVMGWKTTFEENVCGKGDTRHEQDVLVQQLRNMVR